MQKYTPLTAIRNIKEKGLVSALSQDWKRTKQDIPNKRTLTLIATTYLILGIPGAVAAYYLTYKKC